MACHRITFLATALAAACCLVAAGAHAATVAYYKFDNGTADQKAVGKGTILDSSGNGLNGNPSGRVYYESVSNPDSTLAVEFQTKGHVWIPDNPLLQLTHGMTLEAYVHAGNQTQSCLLILRGDSRYAFDPYYLSLNTQGTAQFLVAPKKGKASYIITPDPVPKDRWFHIAATLDDATGVQSIYVDGNLVVSTVTDKRAFGPLVKKDHAGLAIGSNIAGGVDDCTLTGASIDEVRISDVALDPSQFLPPP